MKKLLFILLFIPLTLFSQETKEESSEPVFVITIKDGIDFETTSRPGTSKWRTRYPGSGGILGSWASCTAAQVQRSDGRTHCIPGWKVKASSRARMRSVCFTILSGNAS